MRTKLSREDYIKDNLSWLCIEPLLLTIRGKDIPTKSELYSYLNDGQKALFLFYAFHNHVTTIAELYWFAAYFMSELKAWGGLKNGVRFFNDPEMLSVLETLEKIIEMKNKGADGVWREANPADLEEDVHLNEDVHKLFTRYISRAPYTIELMNSYIREHSEEFVEI
jgi:hypothetical protein